MIYIRLLERKQYDQFVIEILFFQSGFLFALPYIAQLLMTFISGYIAERLRARTTFSIRTRRRAQTIIGKKKLFDRIQYDFWLFHFRYTWCMRIFSCYRLHGM